MWFLYKDDHEDKLVGMSTYRANIDWWTGPGSVKDTTLKAGTKAYALEATKVGIRNGKLFKYNPAENAFHCPGDKRVNLKVGAGFAFDSYSGAGGLNGEDEALSVFKYGQIVAPSEKYVFVEEEDPRGWNLGSWIVDPRPTGGWIDAIAIWHNTKSTLGFGDGHAVTHKWLEGSTIKAAKSGQFGLAYDAKNRDLQYMKHGYAYD